MALRNTSFYDNNDVKSSSEESIILEKEIEDLKLTIKKLRQKLKTVKRNNMKEISISKDEDNLTVTRDVLTNTNYELWTYSGLYGIQSTDNRYIIGFNSSWKEQKQNLFIIEFHKQENNIKIGKWIMPMSVGINQLLSEVPLNKMNRIIPFVENCKHHCNCYMFRLQQYQVFKSSIDDLTNINIQPNVGYTLLIIELLNVYDKINESYANITIYLHYNSKHVRPTEVKTEVTGIIEYDEQTVKKLRKSLKLFCTTDLQTAFDNILKDDNPQFTWKREKKTNTILLTGESSGSDNNTLTSETFRNKRYRKRQRRKVSQIKNGIKKRKNNINNKVDQQSTNEKIQNQLSQNEMHTKTSKSKFMETAYSRKSSRVQKTTVNTTSFLDNLTIELRSKAKSKSTNKMVQNEIKIRPISIRLKKLEFDHTSTPIKPDRQNRYAFRNLPKWDISDIK